MDWRNHPARLSLYDNLTKQNVGLWYTENGEYDPLDFTLNSERLSSLDMTFDPNIPKGFQSYALNIMDLLNWFSENDLYELNEIYDMTFKMVDKQESILYKNHIISNGKVIKSLEFQKGKFTKFEFDEIFD